MSANLGNDGGQEVDLNLAPIIDCFTVLITFMLVSASFLSIGIIDAGVSSSSSKSDMPPPPITIEVSLSQDQSIELKVSGKMSQNTKLAPKSEKKDLDRLKAELGSIKGKFAGVDTIILKADDSVEYSNVIESMEAARKVFPNVLLGGI